MGVVGCGLSDFLVMVRSPRVSVGRPGTRLKLGERAYGRVDRPVLRQAGEPCGSPTTARPLNIDAQQQTHSRVSGVRT